MYPGSQFNWIDLSDINSKSKSYVDKPLFFMISSFDKGPEEIKIVDDSNFNSLYGENMNYFKHGQPAIQCQRIVNSGGRIMLKRLVSDSATLANIIIIANVSTEEVDKTDQDGNQLYIQADGSEGLDITDTKATISNVVIKYTASSVENAKNFSEVKEAAYNLCDYEGTKNSGVFSYPLYIFTDNGRQGSVSKKIRIKPDYQLSRNLNFVMYQIDEIEKVSSISKVMDTARFSVNPNLIYLDKSMTLYKSLMNQIITDIVEGAAEEFVNKLAELTGYTIDELFSYDLLFAKTHKGVPLDGIRLDVENGLALDNEFGLILQNGSDGEFKNVSFGTTEWETQAINYLDGKYTDDIYDVDLYKVDFITDSNYPNSVKRKLETLVDFRQDCFYFRDLGLGLSTYDAIVDADLDSKKSRFSATYLSTYDILDPVTKKQVPVTMMYDFSALLVNHYNNGVYRPLAGQLNQFIITNIIDGTVNFTPKITPKVNQKTLLEDARINYISNVSGKWTVETLYTSQEKYTQASYINNVLAVQQVVKAIRGYCPKIRYQFLDGSDFTKYKEDCEVIINKFSSNFKYLQFIYTQDPELAAQKIFKAALKVTFNNFVQSEIFDIYLLG